MDKKILVASHGLIKNENKYLIIRRSDKESYLPLIWDIPGGKVEFGETSEGALLREISEEVGIKIEIDEVIYVHTNITDVQYFQIIYLCKYISGNVNLDINEHIEYKWLGIDEIKSLDVMPYIKGLFNTNRL